MSSPFSPAPVTSSENRRMPRSPFERLQKICLALPEAHEQLAWNEPTFRVKNKMFAMYANANNHHGGGRHAVWVKASIENQRLLVTQHPDRLFIPPYVGPSGWIGVWLDKKPDWKAVSELITDAYLRVAPKKLAEQIRT